MNFSQLHERLRLEMLRRIERGVLTSALLARQTGVVPAHISNFLNRKRMLSLRTLDAMLRAQRLSVADLVPDAVSPSRTPRISADHRSDTVPLVAQSTAIHDSHISANSLLDLVRVRHGLLEGLREKCPARRRNWERFVAVRITAQQAESMRPVLPPKSVLLVDRHYNSAVNYSSDARTVYAVRDGSLLRFRYVEVSRNHLVLRPHSRSHPVELLDLAEGQSAADLIVGRVFLIIAEI
jgi:hypothetical protein